MSHARDFGLESGNEEAARQIVFDYRKATLSPQDQLLCSYAVKLTLQPGKCGLRDITALSTAGFSDEQITVAVQVIGYFNYINRIAEGLGVEAEEWMSIDRDDWLAKKARLT